MKVTVKKQKFINIGRSKPRIKKFNHIFCRKMLEILYGKNTFCLKPVVRRDKFMLSNVQNILSGVSETSKTVEMWMVRIGNFLTNNSSLPFNTNCSILKQYTLSLIITLQKIMKFLQFPKSDQSKNCHPEPKVYFLAWF